MKWWKWVGLASVVGVVATGAVVARSERHRRAYTPDEVRAKLHARLDERPPEPAAPATPHRRRLGAVFTLKRSKPVKRREPA
ncbi:MAG TPA: hypothetical protein VFW55_11080 [Propionicimonas sp.]|nr:hypothetical protein [Propionicimonas sp.]